MKYQFMSTFDLYKWQFHIREPKLRIQDPSDTLPTSGSLLAGQQHCKHT